MPIVETRRPDVGAATLNWDIANDPAAAACPFRAASKLHDGPDIFFNTFEDPRNTARGGSWVVTRYELQREVLQDAEAFSSNHVTDFSSLLGESWLLRPLELDPPEHTKYRALLNPLFSPAKVAVLDEGVRRAAIDLIGAFRNKGRCEFMEAFGRPFPVGVFMRLMGLPLEEMPAFLRWEDGLLHSQDLATRTEAARNIKNYLVSLIAERRARPTGDLVSFTVTSQIDGKPMTDEAALGVCYLLFVGGLDTVAATLGFTFRALAEQPELQRALRADPAIIPDAMEEMIRAHGVVTLGRIATRDLDFHGVKIRKGDRICIPTGLAARDPREYPDPHKIDFARENTRNLSFSAGPHRCIGSHLARREFKIALEEWMRRIPEFHIAPGERPVAHGTSVWGVDRLVLSW